MAFQVSTHKDSDLHKQQPNLAHAVSLEGNAPLWYLDLHMNLALARAIYKEAG